MILLCLALTKAVMTGDWNCRVSRTLNREKCVFSVPELVFFAFKISANGIAPDDKRIDAVRNARPTQNAAEWRSFLGLVNYCARLIPNFATLEEPLQKLTRSDAEWAWGDAQQDAFHRLKVFLTSDCVDAHYNQAAETDLKVDSVPFCYSEVATVFVLWDMQVAH